MSKRHNYWLAWKMKRGLAPRGRSAPMRPEGWLAEKLYKWYFHKVDVKVAREPRAFKQEVGGYLGPKGQCNGE